MPWYILWGGRTDSMDNRTPEKKSTLQYHAEKCPVCNGFGTLKYGTKICQACIGKGYILVPNREAEGQTEGGEDEAR